MTKYNGKHFTDALSFARREHRKDVKEQAAADFAAFAATGAVPVYVTNYDLHLAKKPNMNKPGSQRLTMASPRWRTPRPHQHQPGA